MVERAEQLPNAGGISTTILLTMDADTYTTTSSTSSANAGFGSSGVTRDTAPFPSPHDPSPTTGTATRPGVARTGHRYLVPAHLAKRWAGGDTRIIAVLFSKTKGITAYSSTQRIFTEQQRVALIARDLGCSFPGCDAPPAWCQTHHITEHRHSARTSVDDGTLLCGHHHRHFEQHDWHCIMTNGRPHWVPPAWIDPSRTPRLNTRHR